MFTSAPQASKLIITQKLKEINEKMQKNLNSSLD